MTTLEGLDATTAMPETITAAPRATDAANLARLRAASLQAGVEATMKVIEAITVATITAMEEMEDPHGVTMVASQAKRREENMEAHRGARAVSDTQFRFECHNRSRFSHILMSYSRQRQRRVLRRDEERQVWWRRELLVMGPQRFIVGQDFWGRKFLVVGQPREDFWRSWWFKGWQVRWRIRTRCKCHVACFRMAQQGESDSHTSRAH